MVDTVVFFVGTVFVVVFEGSDVACDVGINNGAVRAACVSFQRALCIEGNGTHENDERRHASVSAENGQSATTGVGKPNAEIAQKREHILINFLYHRTNNSRLCPFRYWERIMALEPVRQGIGELL